MIKVTCEAREILQCLENFRDTTIGIAPACMGTIGNSDLAACLQDAKLLSQLGVHILLIDYAHARIWGGMERFGNIPYLTVPDEASLVQTATRCCAKRLCLVSGTDRIVTSKGHQLDDISLAEAQQLLAAHALVTKESKALLSLAVLACESGISRVHVCNAHRDGALLNELFTDLGAGTMIYAGTPNKETRPITDTDQFGACLILRNTVPHRTQEFVRGHQKELWVFTVDGDVHGLTRLSRQGSALIVRTLTHSHRSNATEMLESLLRAALQEARGQTVSDVVVPVNEIPALMRILPWFKKLGFEKGRYPIGASNQEVWRKRIT